MHMDTDIDDDPTRSEKKGGVQKTYLHFFSGSGCWSYLGRQRGRQLVSLQKNGCVRHGIVQHEVLHALGFHHEQVRSDRDAHVRILFQNIISGFERNFQKVNTNNLGTPYNFDSIMHYSKFAFSKNRQPTIVAKTNPGRMFGLSTRMTRNDIARVNVLYRCRSLKALASWENNMSVKTGYKLTQKVLVPSSIEKQSVGLIMAVVNPNTVVRLRLLDLTTA
nr:low choriolytic enzyme-like [Nerophis lumbriciformis]